MEEVVETINAANNEKTFQRKILSARSNLGLYWSAVSICHIACEAWVVQRSREI
jgi:hypothetical protein